MKTLITLMILLMSLSTFANSTDNWIHLEDASKITCETTWRGISIKYNDELLFGQNRISTNALYLNQCNAILEQAKEENSSVYFNVRASAIWSNISEVLVPGNGFFKLEQEKPEDSNKWILLQDAKKITCKATMSGLRIKYNDHLLFRQNRFEDRTYANQCNGILEQAKEENRSVYFNVGASKIWGNISEVLVPKNGLFKRVQEFSENDKN